MFKFLGMMTVVSAVWFQSATTATAQNARSMNVAPYASPTVSPYLNLGVNQYGVSNYQSLVKPMIEDREMMANQSMNIQRLQQQLRDAKKTPGGSQANGKESRTGARPVKFMHYSHYFNSLPQ